MPDPNASDKAALARAILARPVSSLDEIAHEIAGHTRAGLRGEDLGEAARTWAAQTLSTGFGGKS